MNWITKNIMGFIADLMSGFLDMFGKLINNVFEVIADINLENQIVVNANNFMVLCSLAFLAFAAGKQILDVYVFQTSGDPDAEPLQLAVRLAQACAVICSSGWLFNEFLKFSKYFTTDLLASASNTDVQGHMKSLLEAADAAVSQFIGYNITLLVILVGLIIFMVVAGIRGAELTLMKVLFPLFAVDLITTNRERWNNFFTTYVVTFLGYSIQLLCFRMCSETFVGLNFDAYYPVRFLTTIGWIVLMIRAPKWMEKFVYSSGVGNLTSSTVRFLPMYLFRMK